MNRFHLYGLLGLGLILAGWAHLRAVPLVQQRRHAERELSDLRQAAPARPGPTLADLRAEVEALRAERDALPPPSSALADPQAAVAARLRAVGLDLEAVQANPPRGGAAAGFQVTASGDFAQITRLVAELRADPPAVRVARLTLALESDPRRRGPLRLELEVAP